MRRKQAKKIYRRVARDGRWYKRSAYKKAVNKLGFTLRTFDVDKGGCNCFVVIEKDYPDGVSMSESMSMEWLTPAEWEEYRHGR